MRLGVAGRKKLCPKNEAEQPYFIQRSQQEDGKSKPTKETERNREQLVAAEGLKDAKEFR